MADDALITLRTNIKAVVDEVVSETDRMSRKLVEAGKATPQQAELVSEIQIKRLREAQRELDKLNRTAQQPGYNGETITAGQQRIYADLRRKIAEDFAAHKIPVDFVADIDTNLKPFTNNLREQVKNAVTQGISEAIVGSTRLRGRANLSNVYTEASRRQPAATPPPKAAPAPTPPAAAGGSGGGGKSYRRRTLGDDGDSGDSQGTPGPKKKAVNRAKIPFTDEQAQGALESRAAREVQADFTKRIQDAQKQGVLEERAAREMQSEFDKRIQSSQTRGQLEARAAREMDSELTRRIDAAQRQGVMETRAAREMQASFDSRIAAAQKSGQLEERAAREMQSEFTRRVNTAQRSGQVEARAAREMEADLNRRLANTQKQGVMETRAAREMTADFQRRIAEARRTGQLEERAAREMQAEFTRRINSTQQRGQLEGRASREMEAEFTRRLGNTQKQGNLETRAAREMKAEFDRRITEAQRSGQLEGRAAKEMRAEFDRRINTTQQRGQLEGRAAREMEAEFTRRLNDGQKRGNLEGRAAREMETEFQKRIQQAQNQGVLEERAAREMLSEFTKRINNTQRGGQLETRAAREMEDDFKKRINLAQREGQLIERAQREMNTEFERRNKATQRQGNMESQARSMMDADFLQRGNARNNAFQQERIFPDGLKAAPIDGVKEIAPNVFREMREGTERYFRIVGKELQDLGPGDARALRTDYKRRDKGFVGGLTEGLFGDRDYEDRTLESLGKSAGITAKYASLATVFYGLQNAIMQAGVELLDFEDSMTNLETAMNDVLPDQNFFERLIGAGGPDQSFINELGESASLAGANVGQAMDLAASAMRTFGDETTQSKEAMEEMGARFAAEASKIATLAGTDIKDAGGNLKATALGFNIPTENFSRVTDVYAGAREIGGGDEKQVGQFLANIAVSAKEAGFAIEEVGALGSKVIAETDQGGQLVANRFSRLFSIIGGSAGKAAITKLNKTLTPDQQIDTGANIRDQIVGLSAVYKDLGTSQQQMLINSLGGTANARELLILLDKADGLVKEVADESWAGKGAEQYKKTLLDMRGVLTRITGDIKAIVTQISQSGIIDPFLALIKFGLLPALDATKNLLGTFNLIPHPLRSIALSLLGIYATTKLIGKATKTDAFTNAAGSFRQTLTGNPMIGPARPLPDTGRTGRQLLRGDSKFTDLSAAATRNASKGYAASVSGLARGTSALGTTLKTVATDLPGSIKKGVGGLGKGASDLRGRVSGKEGLLASELGPLAIAIGGAFAINETFQSGLRINKALDQAQVAKGTKVEDIGVEEFNEVAKNLRASASELRNASSGFFGSVTNFVRGAFGGETTEEGAAELEVQARYNERQAGRLKAMEVETSKGTGGELDITGTADEFTASLDAMKASGSDAVDQFNAIIKALDAFNEVGADGEKTLSTMAKYRLQLASGDAARDFAQNTLVMGAQTRYDMAKKGQNDRLSSNPGLDVAKADLEAAKNVDPDLVANEVEKTTKAYFAEGNPSIDTDAGRKALETLLYANLKGTITNPEDRQHAVNSVISRLLTEIPKEKMISAADMEMIIENAIPIAEAAANADLRDYQHAGTGAPGGGMTSTSKVKADAELARLTQLRDEANNLDTSTKEGRDAAMKFNREGAGKKLDDAITDAENEAADATVDDMRVQFNQLQASKPKEDAAGRIKDRIKEIDKELAEPYISSDKRIALQTERAEAVVEQNQQAQLDAMAASRAKFNTFDEVGQAQADRQDAEKILKENFTDKGITSGAAYEEQQRKVDQTRLAEAQITTTRKFAKRESTSFGGDPVEDAKNAYDQSVAELADLEKYAKNSTAYYEKLGEVNKKRRELAEKNADLAYMNAQLDTDMTDPVAQAQNDLDRSTAKLDRDKKNKAPEATLAADRIQVEKDTAALDADLFSQRLSDTQHAHDMGRLSNQAFLEYMTSERARLKLRLASMKTTDQGYRQIVDQIDQLDTAIKSAADTMSGMFNIGNIDIPTPYQVRKALKEANPGNILGANSSLSSGGNVTHDRSNNSVILNGVPIQQVLAIIEDLFGTKARSTANRRVA